MEKLILKDGTELQPEDGSTLGSIIMMLGGYGALETLAGILNDSNLEEVNFTSDGMATGTYGKMALKEPHYCVTQLDNGSLQVRFGLRQKTQQELRQGDIQAAIAYLSDEQALTVPALYPEWNPTGTYKAGDRRNRNGLLYKCLQDHTGQAGWPPEASPSLWALLLIADPDVIPEWVQPDSTNGYATGDRVVHDGKTWESLADYNVWEPGAAGTESLWREVAAEP